MRNMAIGSDVDEVHTGSVVLSHSMSALLNMRQLSKSLLRRLEYVERKKCGIIAGETVGVAS